MTTATDIKAAHRAMWALGDYAAVAEQIIPELGEVLTSACRIRPGDTVLDVAAGSGNAAIPAALTGATVTASDLTPRLLEIGQALAKERDAELTWVEADAEKLPFGDAAYDVVMSCVGVMFVPQHETTAAELLRVSRPGGTIGLINWTPEGFIGQMFAVMKPFAAPPPPGAQPPPLWGKEEHVRSLLGDGVTDVVAQKRTVVVDRFGTPEAFRDYFKANYGPTISAYNRNAEDSTRTAELDAALDEHTRRFMADGGRMEWEYLLLTAVRTGK